MKNIFYEYLRDKSPVMKAFIGKSSVAKAHFHRNIELIYVISGEVVSEVGEEAFTARDDEIIFVHNYYIHSYRPGTEYRKYVLIIPSDYADDIDKIVKSSTLPPVLSDTEFNRENIKPIIKKLCDEVDTMPSLVKKGYVNVIIGLLFERYPNLPVKTAANIEMMVDILHYIDEHYKEPLTLESISGVFGYNKYYFSRIFNRYIGESLSNYINVVRVQHFMRQAKEMENPQISKLAEECGFESMPTFYRAFSKLYGESPKSYFAKK